MFPINLKKIPQEIKTIAKNGAIHILIGNTLNKFVAFFNSVFLVHILSKIDFAVYSFAYNLYSYSLLLAGFGLQFATLRFTLLQNTIEKKANIYSYIIRKGTINNTIIVIIGIIYFSYIFPYNTDFYKYKWFINILLFMIPFQYIIDASLYTDRAMMQTHRYAYLSAFSSVGIVFFRVLGALIGGLKGIALFSILGIAIIAIIFYKLIQINYYKDVPYSILDNKQKKEISKFSLQYMITNSYWALFMLNDTLLLGQLSKDVSIVADYKIASVFPGFVSILSTSVGVFIAPYFVSKEQEKDYCWIMKYWKKSIFITTLLLLGIVGCIWPISSYLVKLFYGEEYLAIVPMMKVLLIGAVVNGGCRYLTANYISIMGKVKYNMIISSIGILLQIVIDINLIPKFGIIGVAYGDLFIYCIMAILLNCTFYKIYKRK